jgi:hypothetical protein
VCSWRSVVTRWEAGLIKTGSSKPVKLSGDGFLGGRGERMQFLSRYQSLTVCLWEPREVNGTRITPGRITVVQLLRRLKRGTVDYIRLIARELAKTCLKSPNLRSTSFFDLGNERYGTRRTLPEPDDELKKQHNMDMVAAPACTSLTAAVRMWLQTLFSTFLLICFGSTNRGRQPT